VAHGKDGVQQEEKEGEYRKHVPHCRAADKANAEFVAESGKGYPTGKTGNKNRTTSLPAEPHPHSPTTPLSPAVSALLTIQFVPVTVYHAWMMVGAASIRGSTVVLHFDSPLRPHPEKPRC
jgi:hypothetical protein